MPEFLHDKPCLTLTLDREQHDIPSGIVPNALDVSGMQGQAKWNLSHGNTLHFLQHGFERACNMHDMCQRNPQNHDVVNTEF